MGNKNEVKSGKKSLWAMLKESMNKASSGCGPGCGCHAEKPSVRDQQKVKPASSATDKKQA